MSRQPTKRRNNIRNRVAKIRARDGDDCCICLEPIDFELPLSDPFGRSFEHKIRKADGGTNHIDNIGLAHRKCNTHKGGEDGRHQRRKRRGDHGQGNDTQASGTAQG